MNDLTQATPNPRRRLVTVLCAAVAAAALAIGGLAAPATAVDEELIVNGGFESGTSGWIVNGTASLATTSDAFTGTGAVRVSGRTGTAAGPMQDLSGKLQAGQTYAVKARVKYDNPNSPATKQFFITMHYGGSTYTNLGTVTPARGQWGYINSTFTIPASQNVATTRIFVETPWASTATAQAAPDTHLMDFTVDDVSLVGAPPPPPPSKTVEVVGKRPGDGNPLIGHKFGADGNAFVHDGRVYMYMTNDTQPYNPGANGISPANNYNAINQLTIISSDDLMNWVDHGEVPVAGAAGIAPFTNQSWAPTMESKVVDGVEKFFLYFANNAGSVGVLTGDTPVGPWKSERTSTLINGSTPGASNGRNWLFDPGAFVDDDGQAYLVFGGGGDDGSGTAENALYPRGMRIIKLGDDMVSTSGSAEVVEAVRAFEAGHIFKREDKYYLTYSANFGFGYTGPVPEGFPPTGSIPYLMSDSAMGPWTFDTYAGTVFRNPGSFFGVGGNNHQSVFEFEGKYYFTYHAQTLNQRIVGSNTVQGYRSPHIAPLNFNADGTIQEVIGNFDGVDQVHDFDPYRTFEAETFGWSKGIATQKVDGGSAQFGATAPNLVVKDIDNGDWTALSSVDFGDAGPSSVTVKVKALQAGGSIDLRTGSETGPVVGNIPVNAPVGQWAELTADLEGLEGTHDLFFTYKGGSGDLFELDTWSFAEAAAPSVEVSAEATSRCVSGKAVLTVKVTNADEVPVTASVTTPYGAKSSIAVAAGKSASAAFTTRLGVLPSGVADVVVNATVAGQPVSATVAASFPARDCG